LIIFGGRSITFLYLILAAMKKLLSLTSLTIDFQPKPATTNITIYNYRSKNCDKCQSDNEDEDHIILCRSVQRQKIRQEWMNALKKYLSEPYTPENIRNAIIND
jgi:hypothetical protein